MFEIEIIRIKRKMPVIETTTKEIKKKRKQSFKSPRKTKKRKNMPSRAGNTQGEDKPLL